MTVAEVFSDPYKTVVAGMVVTSFLAALPKPAQTPTTKLGVLYKFAYEWMTGFWSLKTGRQEQNPTQAGTVPPQPKES